MIEEIEGLLAGLEKPSDDELDGAEPLDTTFTNFSKKKYLRYDGGKLYGGWARSFGGACIKPWGNSYLHKDSILDMREVGKCAGSGDMIVMCTHH